MRAKSFSLPLLILLLGGCGQNGNDAAGRGKQVYLAECIACHHSDPAKDGPLGPAVKGSSQELLEAKILRGSYPPGYTPKRPTALMPPMPKLAAKMPDLAAFLR